MSDTNNISASLLQVQEQNLNNDFTFVKSLLDAGKLRIAKQDGYHFNMGTRLYTQELSTPANQYPNFLEDFRTYIKSFEEMYPNQWNIEMDKINDEFVIFGVSVNFEKIRMTNRNGAVHTIRGVVGLTPILVDTSSKTATKPLRLGRFSVGRYIQTEREQRHGFFHSHLRSGNVASQSVIESRRSDRDHRYTFYQDMCLGDSSQGILAATYLFNRGPREQGNLSEYLINIRSTLRYESLEGGPYRQMSEVIGSSRNNNARLFNFNTIYGGTVRNLGDFLLKAALKYDANLSFKFDVQAHPLTSKKLVFQDDLKLKEVLIQSFRKLATLVDNKSATIVLENPVTGVHVNQNLHNLSHLFKSKIDYHGSERIGYPLVDNFFIPEAQERPSTEDRVVSTHGCSYIFRGQRMINSVVIPANEVSQSSRVDSQTVDLEIDERYFQMIKNQLIQKLSKNVFKKIETEA